MKNPYMQDFSVDNPIFHTQDLCLHTLDTNLICTKILEYLEKNKNRTVTAADIENYLIEKECAVNKTTIYRFLDKLIIEKKIVKYAAEKGKKATFQYIEDGHHCEKHLHLQCIKCGRIFHLECEFMDEIAAHIQSEHGFFIECKRSIIYGTCRECANAQS